MVKIHTPCPCKEVVARDTAELNSSPPPLPWVSLIAGLEYGMERWNGKWNGMVKWKMEWNGGMENGMER